MALYYSSLSLRTCNPIHEKGDTKSHDSTEKQGIGFYLHVEQVCRSLFVWGPINMVENKKLFQRVGFYIVPYFGDLLLIKIQHPVGLGKQDMTGLYVR